MGGRGVAFVTGKGRKGKKREGGKDGPHKASKLAEALPCQQSDKKEGRHCRTGGGVPTKGEITRSHALTSHSHHDLAKALIKTLKVSCVESVDGLHSYV